MVVMCHPEQRLRPCMATETFATWHRVAHYCIRPMTMTSVLGHATWLRFVRI